MWGANNHLPQLFEPVGAIHESPLHQDKINLSPQQTPPPVYQTTALPSLIAQPN